MKTFYVATVKYDLEKSPWKDLQFASDSDYVVFSDIHELVAFTEHKVSYNAIDDCYVMNAQYETLNKIYCILADNYIEAIKRAWKLCQI